VTELLRPHLTRIMADRYDPKRSARHVGRYVRSWEHFLAGLPDEIQAILDQAKTGQVGIEFPLQDADHAVDCLLGRHAVAKAAQTRGQRAPDTGPKSLSQGPSALVEP
jgi:ubiquinone biosynthesis protein